MQATASQGCIISVDRKLFAKRFSIVADAAAKRSPKPILQCMRVEFAESEILLSATDLEVGLVASVPCNSEGTGVIVIGIERVKKFLGGCKDASLTMTLKNGSLRIADDRSAIDAAAAYPAEEFPAVHRFSELAYSAIPAGFFSEVCKRSLFAVDPESSRYALGGVCVELNGHAIAVSSDGRRLLAFEGPCHSVNGHETAPGSKDSCLVLPKMFKLAAKLLGRDPAGEVKITVLDSWVYIGGDNWSIATRRIEGRFPAWRDVFPAKPKIKVELLAGQLLDAVNQAAQGTDEENVGVDFCFHNDTLRLASYGPTNKSESFVPLPYSGPKFTIRWNPDYVADFLGVIDPQTPVVIGMNKPEHAAEFTTEDGCRYVLMPLARDR